MAQRIEFRLNGAARSVESDPHRTLLELLREDLGLTGTKYGCGEGQCRACTVLIGGLPIQSCLVPVTFVASKDVRTIEGLAQGEELHPMQRAFVEHEAMQCGYCVPGMILSAVALLEQNAAPTREEIVAAMDGHLCRCGGYPRILEAIESAARSSGGGGGR